MTRGPLYRAFIRWCQQAGIQTRTLDAEGHEVEHVDVHSLRRTFATNLIVNGTDPKTVQELLGHKTLAMTMNLYAKIHTGTKRQAIGRLSYGAVRAVMQRIAQQEIPMMNIAAEQRSGEPAGS